MLAVEFFSYKVDDDIVPILATQPMIAIGRDHINVVSLDPHDGDVESSTSKIEYEHRLILIKLIEAVSEGCCGWFVNNL